MQWMTRADLVLLAVASFVAVTALVRLMQRRRDALVADVQRQMEARKRAKRSPDHEQPTRGAA